jgi:hypothetical protein
MRDICLQTASEISSAPAQARLPLLFYVFQPHRGVPSIMESVWDLMVSLVNGGQKGRGRSAGLEWMWVLAWRQLGETMHLPG